MKPARAATLVCFLAVACETETPTSAVVDNAYPSAVVYRTWWAASYFAQPVPPGEASAEARTVPGRFVAYAVLAPGWDPRSPTPPSKLVALKSKAPLEAVRGEVLRIEVSDETFAGDCSAGQALTQEDADFVTTRIFPGEFAAVRYDAATCASTAK